MDVSSILFLAAGIVAIADYVVGRPLLPAALALVAFGLFFGAV